VNGLLLPKVGGLAAAHAAWRATGARSAGRVLVRALSSPDETVRTVAGILLEKGGRRRAAPVLYEAVERRESLDVVLLILADLEVPGAEPVLARFTDDPDPEVARSAREGLRILAAAEGEALPTSAG